MLASLTPLLPIIAPAPIVPPLAFMLLLAWRLMRPGLLPLWAGLPLGAFDDLFSGQPFGSGILLFSLTLIGLELLDARFPWRSFWQDWIIAIGDRYLPGACGAGFRGPSRPAAAIGALVPQFLLSLVAFPDRRPHRSRCSTALRLLRVRRLG